ncbi:hypothetical protein KAI32_04305 [Candidatus Pacearchaeota archaeon]|nr:hypothetical protein [Candidatus Pacearchaeota archaeon]
MKTTNQLLNDSNKRKIKDYVIIPALAAFSLPVAGVYLAARKNIGGKFLNAVMGAGLSFTLALGTYNFQIRDVAKYEVGNIQIEHNYDYSINSKNTPTLFDWVVGSSKVLVTNCTTLDLLVNPPKDKITTITVNAKDGYDNVKGVYKLNDFQTSLDLKNVELPEPEKLALDGILINGDIGKQAYGALCKKTFESAQKEF